MSITGDKQSAPLRIGYPVADTAGGLTAAFAIAACLVERDRKHGRFIDVSMLDSMMTTMGWAVSNLLNAGIEPMPLGNERFTASPSGTFYAADGTTNLAPSCPMRSISAKVIDFLDRNDPKKTSKPFFVWYNPARMHVNHGCMRATCR